jgi:hypothetical protein
MSSSAVAALAVMEMDRIGESETILQLGNIVPPALFCLVLAYTSRSFLFMEN